MSNNTPIFWEANGLSLHTHAWSVRSFGGRRYVPASRRGENLQVPFRRGRIMAPKVRDALVLSLSMWVVPLNPDGSRDDSMSMEQKLHENWRTLLNSLDVDGEFDLVKRWWDGPTVKAATGRAEFVEGLEPQTEGGYRQTFSVDLMLADPYFYAPVAAAPVGTINVQGDVPTDHVVLTLSGGVDPRVTFPDGNWVEYQGSPGTTDVQINLLTGMAKRGANYVNGAVRRNSNWVEWPRLHPGSQALTLTGGGTATVAYDAAWR